ncbi:MAG TPA: hypothetical protein VKX49_11485 [Bryobacteraceae bacterium]|nr:hypothetical protein [Bryobacteraceae bacterium]
MGHSLPTYRVRAVNIAPDSENKIHDDAVAAQYGFRGGLVVGVTVYGYMAQPVIAYAPEWLQHGSMSFRLFEPFYDGDQVVVKAVVHDDGSIAVAAERDDGSLAGKAVAIVNPDPAEPPVAIPEVPLPSRDDRPAATRETVLPGALLGTIEATLETTEPAALLQLSNQMLVQNFRLGPWIHAASDLRNWSSPMPGERISARGRICERFDRKGHEFLSADVMLVGEGGRLIQSVRHTAIYKIRAAGAHAS